jgi:tetratricopeptide (TPR) repeat protein
MDFFGRDRRAALAIAASVERNVQLAVAGSLEPALAGLEDIVRQHAQARDPRIRECVAKAMYHQGVVLRHLGRGALALERWRELARSFGADAEPEILSWVGRALFNAGTALQRNGDGPAAIHHYEELVSRLGNHSTQEALELVCDGLSNLSFVLHEQARDQDAVKFSKLLLTRLEAPALRHLHAHRINALGTLSDALGGLGQHAAALGALDRALLELETFAGPDRVERVVNLLNSKGALLRELGQLADAAQMFDAAFQASAGQSEPDVVLHGARALSNKALVLGLTGAFDAELATLSLLIESFVGRPDAQLTSLVVAALLRSYARLKELGRDEEAQVFRARFDGLGRWAQDAEDQQIAARALMSHAKDMDNVGDRIDVLDAVVDALDKHPGAGMDELLIARARLAKGVELAQGGQLGAAIEAWDDARQRLSARQDEDAAELSAVLLMNRAMALHNLGCGAEACAELWELIGRLEGVRAGAVSDAVLAARQLHGQITSFLAERPTAAARPVGLPETLGSLRAGLGAAARGEPPQTAAHFVDARLEDNAFVVHLRYAAHDREKQAQGITGFALIASLINRLQQDNGQCPSAIVVQSVPKLGNADQDANFRLLTESMAVFGLPLRTAAQQTHLGTCAEVLGYTLDEVGLVTGAGLVCRFESTAGTTRKFS